MPTYDFNCPKCDEPFEIIQGIKEYDGKGACPRCEGISTERIFSAKIHFIGASVESAEYNPGLGLVTKNSKHRKDEARARGLEEVGTESTAKILAHDDRNRAEKLKKSWDEV